MATRAKTTDVPEDFERYAANENDSQLGERFGITRRQAARMRRNLGIQSTHPRVNPPKLPADFAEIAACRTNSAVEKHYGVGNKTVLRWRKESGVAGPAVVARPFGAPSGQPYRRVITEVYTRPSGITADAANFLRGKGFTVYNRVIEDKKLDGQFVVGRMKFESADAMIAYARERGLTS